MGFRVWFTDPCEQCLGHGAQADSCSACGPDQCIPRLLLRACLQRHVGPDRHIDLTPRIMWSGSVFTALFPPRRRVPRGVVGLLFHGGHGTRQAPYWKRLPVPFQSVVTVPAATMAATQIAGPL